MKEKVNHVKGQEKRYTVERRYWGQRNAEDVVTALFKAHR